MKSTHSDFEKYYLNQIGHGMPVFAGAAMQRGHGIGNVLRGLFRVATPLIRTIGRQALKRSKNPILREVGAFALDQGIEANAGKPSKRKRRKGPAPSRGSRTKLNKGRPQSKRRPAKRRTARSQDIFSQ